MPQLSDIVKKRADKKFKKKEYRPWDLQAGEGDTQISSDTKEEPITKPVEVAETHPEPSIIKGSEKNSVKSSDKDSKQVVNESGLAKSKFAEMMQRISSEEAEDTSGRFEAPTEQLVTVDSGQSRAPLSNQLQVRDRVLALRGHQRNIFVYILKNTTQSGKLTTTPILGEELMEQFDTSPGTIKNAIRRLESKMLIKSISKRARGGFFQFVISEDAKRVGQQLMHDGRL